jgi:hypothetical protein
MIEVVSNEKDAACGGGATLELCMVHLSSFSCIWSLARRETCGVDYRRGDLGPIVASSAKQRQ